MRDREQRPSPWRALPDGVKECSCGRLFREGHGGRNLCRACEKAVNRQLERDQRSIEEEIAATDLADQITK